MHRYPIVICNFKGERHVFFLLVLQVYCILNTGVCLLMQARANSQLSRFWLPQLNFQETGEKRSCQHRGFNFVGIRICLSRKWMHCFVFMERDFLRFGYSWNTIHNLFTKRSKWKDADRGLLCLRRALQSADGHIPSDSHEYRIVVLLCSAGDACHVFSLYEVLFILILWTLDCL